MERIKNRHAGSLPVLENMKDTKGFIYLYLQGVRSHNINKKEKNIPVCIIGPKR